MIFVEVFVETKCVGDLGNYFFFREQIVLFEETELREFSCQSANFSEVSQFPKISKELLCFNNN
jgi:hypothetical protein